MAFQNDEAFPINITQYANGLTPISPDLLSQRHEIPSYMKAFYLARDIADTKVRRDEAIMVRDQICSIIANHEMDRLELAESSNTINRLNIIPGEHYLTTGKLDDIKINYLKIAHAYYNEIDVFVRLTEYRVTRLENNYRAFHTIMEQIPQQTLFDHGQTYEVILSEYTGARAARLELVNEVIATYPEEGFRSFNSAMYSQW